MMKKILIVVILFNILNGRSIPLGYCQSEKDETKQLSVSYHFLGYKYLYGDLDIKRKEFYELIELVPTATVELKKAKRKSVVSVIFSSIGGFLIGWEIGGAISGQESSNLKLAGLGVIFVFTSIGFEGSLFNNYQKAAEDYNTNIKQLDPDIVYSIVNKNRYKDRHYDFELVDGLRIYGELLSKRDGELHVRDKSTVYFINLNKLHAIYQYKVDVTDVALIEAPTKYIDLFNYNVIEIN